MALFRCQNLDVGHNGHAVVHALNFSVEPADCLYVVGDNGSGKSTLVKTLLRLIPPLAGSILVGDGLERDEIGYLPQQPPGQGDFPASVREIALSGCLNRCGWRPFYSRAEKRLARNSLARTGMQELARHAFPSLSGGQQRRVLLARALCATRRLLLLDEPAAGLDPEATAEMYALVNRLNREDGIAVLMVSHDIRAAVRDAKHILHLGPTPLFFGTAAEYAQSPFYQAFLDEEGRVCHGHHV